MKRKQYQDPKEMTLKKKNFRNDIHIRDDWNRKGDNTNYSNDHINIRHVQDFHKKKNENINYHYKDPPRENNEDTSYRKRDYNNRRESMNDHPYQNKGFDKK